MRTALLVLKVAVLLFGLLFLAFAAVAGFRQLLNDPGALVAPLAWL